MVNGYSEIRHTLNLSSLIGHWVNDLFCCASKLSTSNSSSKSVRCLEWLTQKQADNGDDRFFREFRSHQVFLLTFLYFGFFVINATKKSAFCCQSYLNSCQIQS
jgi:hypothetical protein